MGLLEVSLCDITRVSCVIYFLCLFYYCFYLFFLWRSNSCKKVYLYDKDILLMLFFLALFFINLWLGGFFCCISFLQFLLISLFCFWRLSSLLFLSLGFVVLSLSHLLFLGYLTPSCVRFLNYSKEGEETFIWMFSFPEACRGGGEQMLGWRSWNLLFFFLMT